MIMWPKTTCSDKGHLFSHSMFLLCQSENRIQPWINKSVLKTWFINKMPTRHGIFNVVNLVEKKTSEGQTASPQLRLLMLVRFVPAGRRVPSGGNTDIQILPLCPVLCHWITWKQFALTLNFSVSKFIGDFKVSPSLLKMAGAAVLWFSSN